MFQTKSSTLALVGPAILNCKCGTFRVTGASAAPLVESPQSLCSRLHKLPHDKQATLPRACPSVRCSSPVPHGWYVAANQLNYRRLHPAVENTNTRGFSSDTDFSTLTHRELTVCSTKPVHGHLSQGEKRGSAFPIPFFSSSCPLTLVSKSKTL